MQLNDILADAEDQDRGREFELRDPVTGEPTGIKLRIAGPDSATQARGRIRMADGLADMADDEGKVTASRREKLRQDFLAGCVLAWDISEDGQPIPFNHANVLRLVKSAFWVQQQVDLFASNRAVFGGHV